MPTHAAVTMLQKTMFMASITTNTIRAARVRFACGLRRMVFIGVLRQVLTALPAALRFQNIAAAMQSINAVSDPLRDRANIIMLHWKFDATDHGSMVRTRLLTCADSGGDIEIMTLGADIFSQRG